MSYSIIDRPPVSPGVSRGTRYHPIRAAIFETCDTGKAITFESESAWRLARVQTAQYSARHGLGLIIRSQRATRAVWAERRAHVVPVDLTPKEDTVP